MYLLHSAIKKLKEGFGKCCRTLSCLAVIFLCALIITSCASRARNDLASGQDPQELDDFESFEDAFTRAAEQSVVGDYIGKGRAANLVIYFDYNSAYLALDGRAALDTEIVKIANGLQRNRNLIIRILGHTDERGSDEYNLALGQRRADSVARYMLTKGIGRDRFQAVSYGEKAPVAPGNGEAVWAENRRVEIVY